MIFETKKTRIKDMIYSILFVNPEYEKLKEYNSIGVCLVDEKIIIIDNRLANDFKKSVLIHEVTHAFIYEYLGLEISRKKFNEEQVADFIQRYGENIISIAKEVMSDE